MDPDAIKLAISALISAVISALATGGYVSLNDVSGARAYKESKAEELVAAEMLAYEVAALRAQNQTLLRLLDGATLRSDPEEDVSP